MPTELTAESQTTEPGALPSLSERLDEDWESLLGRLQSETKEERIAAAEVLGRWGGPRSVDPLCELLRDPDDEIRIAAAEALGSIGDQRAVQPLLAALRERCVGGSGRRQKRAGRMFVSGILGIVVGQAVLCATQDLNFGAMCGGLVIPVISWFGCRAARGPLFRAITQALARIAEARPTLEVREVLPELDVLSTDRIQQDAATRRALAAGRARIETLTAHFKSLPLPSASPAPEAATLPVPAQDAAPKGDNLPRAVG